MMSVKLTRDEFIEKLNQVHDGKVTLLEDSYKGTRYKHKFRCNVCGHEWDMRGDEAVRGRSGCPECAIRRSRKTKDEFLQAFYERFPDSNYDFSQAEYVNSKTKMKVICPEHGPFMMTPNDLIGGHGCAMCKMSGMEKVVMQSLKNADISFTLQKKFKWLGKQSIDFYIPGLKIALECQGMQHYHEIPAFGGADKLSRIQSLDKRKKELCENHGISVVYFVDRRDTKFMQPGDLFFVDTECMTGYFQALKASLSNKNATSGA